MYLMVITYWLRHFCNVYFDIFELTISAIRNVTSGCRRDVLELRSNFYLPETRAYTEFS